MDTLYLALRYKGARTRPTFEREFIGAYRFTSVPVLLMLILKHTRCFNRSPPNAFADGTTLKGLMMMIKFLLSIAIEARWEVVCRTPAFPQDAVRVQPLDEAVHMIHSLADHLIG